MKNNIENILRERIKLCDIHAERMNYALDKIMHRFPLDVEKYSLITTDETSFFDQLIFRFSKLQDTMGGALFPALLNFLGEETRGVPFLDMLNRMEELDLLRAEEWMKIRETRNIVTHEYPFVTKELINGLNLLKEHSVLIVDILDNIKSFIFKRIG